MEMQDRKKVSLIRETGQVILDEDEVIALVREAVEEAYPDFTISNIEIRCGMGQGEGYFEDVFVELTSERQEVEGKKS